jgi:3-oxoadipate enol-lactonase
MKLTGSSNRPLEQIAGSRKVVILGAGFGTTAEVWELAQRHLNPEMNYLRFDLPGHGLSPSIAEPFTVDDLADAVVDLADSLSIDKFCYAGVSIGGAIGLTLALRHPERVNLAMPICSAPKFGESNSWTERAIQVRKNGTAQFAEGTRDRWFSKNFQLRKPEVVAQALQMLSSVDRESYALGCEALASYDLTERLGEIEIPTMVITGELDATSNTGAGKNYYQKLGNGSLIEVLGVAHQAALEAPEVIAKHINYSVRQHK